MNDKILTNTGVEQVNFQGEIFEKEEIKTNNPPAPIQHPQINNRKKLKKIRKDWEEKPEVKQLKLKAIPKSTIILMWISIIALLLIIIIGTIWFNVSFSKKDFSTNIPITNEYNHTINAETNLMNNNTNNNNNNIQIYNNNTIVFPEEMVDVLEKVVEIINDLNSTGEDNETI